MAGFGKRTTVVAAALALGSSAIALAPYDAGAAPALVRCGATVTTDTTLTRDLTCPGTGLRLAKGVTLDLGGHKLTARKAAIDVVATDGATFAAAVRNGTVRGRIAVTGTADSDDNLRVQRLRLQHVDHDGGSLLATDADVVLADSTSEAVTYRVRASKLSVVRSTVSDVVVGAADTSTSDWSVIGSTISGQWWPVGGGGRNMSVIDSSITDTTPLTPRPVVRTTPISPCPGATCEDRCPDSAGSTRSETAPSPTPGVCTAPATSKSPDRR